MRRGKLSLLFLLGLFVIFLSPNFGLAAASAQAVSNRQNFTAEKCTAIQTRIETKITTFDNGNKQNLNAYTNLVAHLNQLESKLVTKGYNTTQLKVDITTLNGKVNTYTDSYGAFITQLKNTQNYACGHSQGDFVSNLASARSLMAKSRSNDIDIRNFYRNVIRADLLAIKSQTLPTTESSENSGSISTNTTNQ